MTQFAYRARDPDGAAVNGVVDGANELSVAEGLRNLGYRVVAIERKRQAIGDLLQRFRRHERIPPQEIILVARQLATMLRVGVPLTNALSSVTEQVRSEALARTLKGVLKDVEAGQALSEALAHHPRAFDQLFTSMVRMGETAGILDQVLERLAVLNGQEQDLRARVRVAMTYPTIVIVAATAIVLLVMVYVVPKFMGIFETYDVQLPLTTRMLLGVSVFIRSFWWLLLAGGIGAAVWVRRILRTEEGRFALDAYRLKLPFIGPFFSKVAASRLARTLGVLVGAGVPILEALEVTETTVGNRVVAGALRNVRASVSEGQSLTEPFAASGVFPPMVIQMMSLGEKSGQLQEMLTQVATYYDEETERMVKTMSAALEPVLLLGVGLLVGFIALSVLVPIFSLVKVFRQGI